MSRTITCETRSSFRVAGLNFQELVMSPHHVQRSKTDLQRCAISSHPISFRYTFRSANDKQEGRSYNLPHTADLSEGRLSQNP